MSYCVNCGVELAPSEPSCPLCGTEVINPRDPWKEPRVRPYPAYYETVVKSVDKRYFSTLAAVLMLVPVAVCLIVDLLSSGEILWSGYVAGAMLCVMVISLIPIAVGRRSPLLYLGLDVLALCGYLFYIDISTGELTWFIPLALPIILSAGAIIGLLSHFFAGRKKRGILVAIAFFFVGAGIFTSIVEVFVRRYLGYGFTVRWSLYALVPCALSAAAFMILNSRAKWKEEVKKRLFF